MREQTRSYLSSMHKLAKDKDLLRAMEYR